MSEEPASPEAARERVGVIGAGYVGLVTGVCLASLGFEVTLRDIDAAKVAALNDGQVPIYEPGLAELMAEHRERLTYTLSLERLLERSDVVFIAVDTPPTYSGDADLSRVMSVVDELQRVGADSRHVLVMKSTVPVGTGERVRTELDAARRRIHGHTYTLRLHLSAPLDEVMGWTMDFGDVKELFGPLFDMLDHQPLHELPGLADCDTASIAAWILQQARVGLPRLDRVDLYETRGCGAIVSVGEEGPALPV